MVHQVILSLVVGPLLLLHLLQTKQLQKVCVCVCVYVCADHEIQLKINEILTQHLFANELLSNS